MVATSGPVVGLVVAFPALVTAGLVLLTVPYRQLPSATHPKAERGNQMAAVRWVMGSRVAITVLLLASTISLLAFSYNALLPAIADRTLRWGSIGLGLLTAAGGTGILVTSPLTDRLSAKFGRARFALGAIAGTGVALIMLGLSTNRLLSAVASAAAAGLLMMFLSTESMMLQALSPPSIRGRAVSLLSLAFWGAIPFGSVVVGYSADKVGLRIVLLVAGGLCVLVPILVTLFTADFASIDVDRFGQSSRLPRIRSR